MASAGGFKTKPLTDSVKKLILRMHPERKKGKQITFLFFSSNHFIYSIIQPRNRKINESQENIKGNEKTSRTHIAK